MTKLRSSLSPENAALMLSDVRGRCRLEDGHWLWAGAKSSDGYPRIWSPDFTRHKGKMRAQPGRRGVWHLAHQRAIPNGWRVFSTCRERLCVSPGHIVCEAVAKQGVKVAKSGRLKGVVARIVANRATNQRRSKLTRAIIEDIRSSPETGEALAARLGLGRQTISKVRRGAVAFDAIGGVFTGLIAANEASQRRALRMAEAA